MSCLHLKREKRKNMGSHCIVKYTKQIWSASCLLLNAKLGICVPWSHSYVIRIVCSLLNIQSSINRAAMTCYENKWHWCDLFIFFRLLNNWQSNQFLFKMTQRKKGFWGTIIEKYKNYINLNLTSTLKCKHAFKCLWRLIDVYHSYDILGVGMLWKPKDLHKIR